MSSSAFQKAYSSAEELVLFSPTASLRCGALQGSQACFCEGRQAACAHCSLVASVLPSITFIVNHLIYKPGSQEPRTAC